MLRSLSTTAYSCTLRDNWRYASISFEPFPAGSGSRVSVAIGKGETPNVWWVNQVPRTFQHSARHGLFFSRQRATDGRTFDHWRRMEEVRAGDIVLHYSDGHVRAVSLVQTPATTDVYPIPSDPEFGGVKGYLVRSEYHLLEPPIPRDSAKNVPSVPETEGPFDKDGKVKFGYLYRYGLDALRELVTRFKTNWPAWVLAYVAPVSAPEREFYNGALQRVVERLTNLRLGIYR